jgi:hypothetical protein
MKDFEEHAAAGYESPAVVQAIAGEESIAAIKQMLAVELKHARSLGEIAAAYDSAVVRVGQAAGLINETEAKERLAAIERQRIDDLLTAAEEAAKRMAPPQPAWPVASASAWIT